MREGPVLQAEGIVAGYGEMVILHGVTVEVRPGEIVCIIGPNGSGKSTLLKAIAGLVRVHRGRVLLEGKEVTGLPPHRLIARGLAYVPQTDNIFPSLTVDENLEMGGYLLADPRRVRERIAQLYDLFPDLAEKRRERADRLSGGQRQMLALARALMLEPRILLLDEPSVGLSPLMVERVYEQIRRVNATGVPILLVEQNVFKGLENSDRAYVLAGGEVRFTGPSHEIRGSEELGRLYLGR